MTAESYFKLYFYGIIRLSVSMNTSFPFICLPLLIHLIYCGQSQLVFLITYGFNYTMFLNKIDFISVQECSMVKCLGLQTPNLRWSAYLAYVYIGWNKWIWRCRSQKLQLFNWHYGLCPQIFTKVLTKIVSLCVNQFFDLQLLMNSFLFRWKD